MPCLAIGHAVGPVEGHDDLAPRRVGKVNDVVNEVLKGHTVSNASFSYRGPAKLPRGTLSRVIAPGQQVERITADLGFDATPDETLAIIGELEASPHIEGIGSVRRAAAAAPGSAREKR